MSANKQYFYNTKELLISSIINWEKGRSLKQILEKSISNALDIKVEKLNLEHPKAEGFGDYSSNIALLSKNNSHKTAEKMVEKLKKSTSLSKLVEKIEVAGNGFINFDVKKEIKAEFLQIASSKDTWGESDLLKEVTIMFEFAHPNPYKSFHIGHLRNILLGESLIRILEANGAKVIRANYQGDVGMHVAKTLWAFLKIKKSAYPKYIDEKVALLAKCYTEGATAYINSKNSEQEIRLINKKIYKKNDKEINLCWEVGRKWSLEKFEQIYSRVDSHFDRYYFESETLDKVDSLIKKSLKLGILIKSQGAIIFDGKKYNEDTRVFVTKEGNPTYEGKELGLAELKLNDFPETDLFIHNVGIEQISFFKTTFKVKELLYGKKLIGKQYHNAYEFVGLSTGKMASRTGNVVLADDILDSSEKEVAKIMKEKGFNDKDFDKTVKSIAVGAVKYSFLNLNPKTYLAFDIKKSLNFEGNSGPYIQYTYARAVKLLKDFDTKNDCPKTKLANNLSSKEEIAILNYVYRFEEAVSNSLKELAPNHLTAYLYNLAVKFNSFYNLHPVLKEKDKDKQLCRIVLTKACANTLKKGLFLLGIDSPNKM